MKIVINALSARQGGGQTYLKNLLAHLPEQEDLELLVYAPESLRLPEERRIRRCSTSWPTENPLLRTVWERLVLPTILRREHADVLFCPGGVVATQAPAGCKTVTMFRNMMPFDQQALRKIPFGLQKIRNFLLKRVMLRSMAGADLTIFISEYARGFIERLTSIRHAVTIAHGIGDAFRTHGKAVPRPAWLPDGEYLLYVSKFDGYKHQLEVVTAFAALPPEIRLRYKLVLAGEADEIFARQVTAFVRSHGLESSVIIAGAIPYAELPGVYHHARLNLFASSCENCPNILLEAMGAGRPVLCSNVMPMPEFGADAVEYFSPFDSASLARVMLSVLSNAERELQLANASARRSSDFDWRQTAVRTWNAIFDVVPQ